MSKVIEVVDCAMCPYKSPIGPFCDHPSNPFEELINTAIIPASCPLEDKDNFCESNFDIDRDP